MKKFIIVTAVVMIALATYGQNFTNTVDQTISHKSNLNYNNGPGNQGDVFLPLTVFLDFTGDTPLSLSVSLKHQGEEATIFSYSPITDLSAPLGVRSPLVANGITAFQDTSIGGNWELTVQAIPSITVHDWGITTIPEPATWCFLLVGLCSLAVFGLNKCKL